MTYSARFAPTPQLDEQSNECKLKYQAAPRGVSCKTLILLPFIGDKQYHLEDICLISQRLTGDFLLPLSANPAPPSSHDGPTIPANRPACLTFSRRLRHLRTLRPAPHLPRLRSDPWSDSVRWRPADGGTGGQFHPAAGRGSSAKVLLGGLNAWWRGPAYRRQAFLSARLSPPAFAPAGPSLRFPARGRSTWPPQPNPSRTRFRWRR